MGFILEFYKAVFGRDERIPRDEGQGLGGKEMMACVTCIKDLLTLPARCAPAHTHIHTHTHTYCGGGSRLTVGVSYLLLICW